MAFEKLSVSEQQAVLRCMKAIAEGPFIDDWEFRTRLGIDRATLRQVLSHWPHIVDAGDDSDECLAINNCMNEVSNGLRFSNYEWEKWFTQSRAEIADIYAKWVGLRGWSRSGIR